MNTTVSTKYQIVIPKDVRKQLNIKPGQKLNVRALANNSIIMQKDIALDNATFIQKYTGVIKRADTAWGKAGMDATKWLRKQRDEDWG